MYRHVRAGFGDRQTDGWLRFRERVVPAKESVHCSCAASSGRGMCTHTPKRNEVHDKHHQRGMHLAGQVFDSAQEVLGSQIYMHTIVEISDGETLLTGREDNESDRLQRQLPTCQA